MTNSNVGRFFNLFEGLLLVYSDPSGSFLMEWWDGACHVC